FVFGTVPILVLLVAGMARMIQGMHRDKPVGVLLVLLLLAFFFAWYTGLQRLPRLTAKGDAALNFLRSKNSALHATALTAPQQLHANEAALGFALFGSAVLAGLFAELSSD